MSLRAIEDQLLDDLLGFVEDQSGLTNLNALDEAIDRGDIESVYRDLGIDGRSYVSSKLRAIIAKRLRQAFEDAIEDELDEYDVPFDTSDPLVAQYLGTMAQEATVAFFVQARQTADGMIHRNSDLEPGVLAWMLAGGVWALDRQSSAVETQAQRMRDEGMSELSIRSLMGRLFGRAITNRLTILGATTITSVASAATRLAIKILMALGLLDAEDEQEWETAADERVCPQCGPYHGVRVRLDEEFAEGPPPLHPVCRCRIRIRRQK